MFVALWWLCLAGMGRVHWPDRRRHGSEDGMNRFFFYVFLDEMTLISSLQSYKFSLFLQDSQKSLREQFPSWIDQERLMAVALLKVIWVLWYLWNGNTENSHKKINLQYNAGCHWIWQVTSCAEPLWESLQQHFRKIILNTEAQRSSGQPVKIKVLKLWQKCIAIIQ